MVEPELSGTSAGIGFARIRAAGATAARLVVPWDAVARSSRPPADATDPASESYSWESIDEQVVHAHRRGLDPILSIVGAPPWAQLGEAGRDQGPAKPDPVELGKFALAAARRYGGGFEGLPRVRYWQLWNEPNLIFYLSPQFDNGRPFSPLWYRRMLNAFAASVHAVHRDNLVVAGGTAPFTSQTGDRSLWGVGPLSFMRTLLCMGRNLKPTCRDRARFDVWGHHPYTSGGPTHKAYLPDDVSLGDLPEMRRLLRAAEKAGRIVSARRIQFWVTEFSWDSQPADPEGVPAALHGRWAAEALYRMWAAGVSLVTWFTLRDYPFPTSPFQSGLYYRGSTIARDRPKPALVAFRFPFVALVEGAGVRLWGRTPTSSAGNVIVEKRNRGWRRVAVVRAGPNGVFSVRRALGRGVYRARFAGQTSLGFSTTSPPDRFVRPFGST